MRLFNLAPSPPYWRLWICPWGAWAKLLLYHLCADVYVINSQSSPIYRVHTSSWLQGLPFHCPISCTGMKLYRRYLIWWGQVYQSDFIAKCMSDRGFLARRGVLELAMSIEACMLSWLEGGCLSTPSTPPLCIRPCAPLISLHNNGQIN